MYFFFFRRITLYLMSWLIIFYFMNHFFIPKCWSNHINLIDYLDIKCAFGIHLCSHCLSFCLLCQLSRLSVHLGSYVNICFFWLACLRLAWVCIWDPTSIFAFFVYVNICFFCLACLRLAWVCIWDPTSIFTFSV